MQVRTPAVAGMFYAGEKNQLKKSIHDCYLHSFGPKSLPPSSSKKNIIGMICPHAGFMYSGPIACHSVYEISANQYETFIIIGPNHWGIGCNVSSIKECTWETPLGEVIVDSKLADELVNEINFVELDLFSHTKEHSIEVQIPMLQEAFQNAFKILPISLIDQTKKTTVELGKAVAKISKKNKVMIVGSSDFTHYEPNDVAHKQDKALIEPILRLDIDEFYKVLEEKQVSACGYGAIAATMQASKELGATEGKLLKYATSGDITGEKSSVVGYGSIVFS
ncbi:hypothetical protein C6988_08800 [Nitrosopumilus sp. b1]|uniref:AmmeMemoRadiSam system protein B n=1 Tax=Nitrosopumilus sp. b1 TaxID=2109907 RepID=UPI0015F6EA0F|nr:AmmeMemoRadiSam system protein B [Nitrosopumilus sp. b1]KAF6242316.1 hypothetical protein C6988_08800 [Nitrosopumilus sp. b1]